MTWSPQPAPFTFVHVHACLPLLMALKLYGHCCVACSKHDWVAGRTCTAAVAAKDHDKPKAGPFILACVGVVWLVLVMVAACVVACRHVGCEPGAAFGACTGSQGC